MVEWPLDATLVLANTMADILAEQMNASLMAQLKRYDLVYDSLGRPTLADAIRADPDEQSKSFWWRLPD